MLSLLLLAAVAAAPAAAYSPPAVHTEAAFEVKEQLGLPYGQGVTLIGLGRIVVLHHRSSSSRVHTRFTNIFGAPIPECDNATEP
jgi:hypothetical protein